MTTLGRDAPLTTAARQYPAGLRPSTTAPNTPPTRMTWAAPVALQANGQGGPRGGVSFGRFALTEQDTPVKTSIRTDNLVVQLGSLETELSPDDCSKRRSADCLNLPDRARAPGRTALPGLRSLA